MKKKETWRRHTIFGVMIAVQNDAVFWKQEQKGVCGCEGVEVGGDEGVYCLRGEVVF